jgi:hypothetical protein
VVGAKAEPPHRPQSVLSKMIAPRSLQGDIITESTDFSSLPHSVRLFPCRVPGWTLRRDSPPNENPIAAKRRVLISVGELLRVFGLVVLMTRFKFGKRHDLWKTSQTSKYIPGQHLERQVSLATGSTRHPGAFVSAICQKRKGKSALFGTNGSS